MRDDRAILQVGDRPRKSWSVPGAPVTAGQLFEETLKAAPVIAGFSLPVVMMVKESVNRAFVEKRNTNFRHR